ncbi:MAG: hypothetical protein K0S55_695 [Clostridia bacterium]|nr:hypothetical protein [Clostridia bacterium]
MLIFVNFYVIIISYLSSWRGHLIMKKRMNKHKGFTLIELIVVISIIGILTAIIAPNFSSLLEDSKKATVENSANYLLVDLKVLLNYDGDDFLSQSSGNEAADLTITLKKYMPSIIHTAIIDNNDAIIKCHELGNVALSGLSNNASQPDQFNFIYYENLNGNIYKVECINNQISGAIKIN